MMADLRSPLPPEHLYLYQCNSDKCPLSSNVDGSTKQPLSSSHQSIIEGSPFLLKLLANIYTSNSQLQLSTETSFASFVLFHRFLSHYLHEHVNFTLINDQSNKESVLSMTRTEERRRLGNIAAASIFLACKLNNEQRRIRDVINMKHTLQFDSNCTGFRDDGGAESDLIINNPLPPPKLDEEYWKQKEEMVRTEQTLLRVIKFDVNISYPHRVMVVVWEEFVKLTSVYLDDHDQDHNIQQEQGRSTSGTQVDTSSRKNTIDIPNGNNFHIPNSTKVNVKQIDWNQWWRDVLKSAWKRINDSVFHVDSLSCSVADLACAAISLALSDCRNVTWEVQIDALFQHSYFSEWWEWVGVDEASMKLAKGRLSEACRVLCRVQAT